MARFNIFLDRDGTINVDHKYIGDPNKVELISGAGEAIKMLNEIGDVSVFIVSNQSGINRGYFTEADLLEVNKRLYELLDEKGARINGMNYCPHRPDEGCGCRKPEVGLLMITAIEHDIMDLASSYVVGDKLTDSELGVKVGGRGILVRTGKGVKEEKLIGELDEENRPTVVLDDLMEAAKWIVADINSRTEN